MITLLKSQTYQLSPDTLLIGETKSNQKTFVLLARVLVRVSTTVMVVFMLVVFITVVLIRVFALMSLVICSRQN